MKRLTIIFLATALAASTAFAVGFHASVAGRGFGRAVQKVGERDFTADLFDTVDATTHTLAAKSAFKTAWARGAADHEGYYPKVYDLMSPAYQAFVKDAARQILLDDQAAKKATEDAEITALE